MKNGFSSLLDGIGDLFDWLLEGIGGLFEWLLDGLGSLLSTLFVPEDAYFDEKINDFKSEFAFIDSVSTFVDRLMNALTSGEFASLEVNLGAAEGKINYGTTKVNILDVSWYSRYKSYGDSIISAFLWIAYLLSLYKQLPGIISGTSGLVHEASASSSKGSEGKSRK